MSDFHTLLEQPAVRAMEDHTLLDRVVQTVCLERNLDYVNAVLAFEDAATQARRAHGNGATIGKVLEQLGVSEAAASSELRLLERRDSEVQHTLEQQLKPLAKEAVDGQGRVALKAGPGKKFDLLSNPRTRFKRLERARKAAPGRYPDEQGAKLFDTEDRAHIEAGIDLVRTLERPAEIAAARDAASDVGRQLDQAIATGRDARARWLELDGQVRQLQAERKKVKPAAYDPASVLAEPAGEIKLLDNAAAKKRKKGKKKKRKLSFGAQTRMVQLTSAGLSKKAARKQVKLEAGGRIYMDQLGDEWWAEDPLLGCVLKDTPVRRLATPDAPAAGPAPVDEPPASAEHPTLAPDPARTAAAAAVFGVNLDAG
jgi:hypothetical protein